MKTNMLLITKMFRKSDSTKPLTQHEKNIALLKLEQHINSFPLLNFDDVSVSVRIHMKGEDDAKNDDPDTCTIDDRHPSLRCG